MRKLFGLLALVTLAAVPATAAWHVIGVPSSVTAKGHIHRGTPTVIVQWTDTAATIVRSEIRRRGIRADTLLGGRVSDTTWSVRGATQGGLPRFEDKLVTLGRTYRYQVRDSIGGAAFSSWSDSASITLTARRQ